MTPFIRLLSPAVLGFSHHLKQASWQEWFRHLILLAFGLSFCVVVFLGFHWVLNYFHQFGLFGSILIRKVLTMLFLFFLVILFFSNLITSLSTYYLSQDMQLLMSFPISSQNLFRGRFLEGLFASTWMIFVFGMLILFAYGIVLEASWIFYLLAPLTLAIFTVIPAGFASLISLSLVSIFPARSTRDFLFFVGILFLISLYLFLRFLQPEQLINPENFSTVVQYLSALKTPDSLFLPSHWAAESIKFLLPFQQETDWLWPALLVSTAAGFWVLGGWCFEWLHREGWSKSQEAKRQKLSQKHGFENFLMRTVYGNPSGITRPLFLKDIRLFFRDSIRWSQLLMILALVIVYIYNFRVLNLRQIPLNQFNLEFLVTFLNLAMAAFVLAALGARFVFPAVSLEGQAFWILRTAPISLKKYLWNKFWIALPPITVLGIVLMGVTNFLLNIRWEFHLISFMAILPLSISLVALSTGMGAIYPQFKYENVAKVTTGFGGIIYMVFALAFILAIVALLSIGVLAHFQIIARGNVFQIPLIIGCIVLTLTLFGITIFIPMNMGIKNLETKEI